MRAGDGVNLETLRKMVKALRSLLKPIKTIIFAFMSENEKNIEPVEVFSGTEWQAGMVKSLLENAEIEAFLFDEIIGTLNPWWTAPGGAGSVRVFVSSDDFEKARIIVEEYDKNLSGK